MSLQQIVACLVGIMVLMPGAQASAQSRPVYQTGPITPGHVPQWETNGVQGDSGAPLPPFTTLTPGTYSPCVAITVGKQGNITGVQVNNTAECQGSQ